jgi:hypothetical protein
MDIFLPRISVSERRVYSSVLRKPEMSKLLSAMSTVPPKLISCFRFIVDRNSDYSYPKMEKTLGSFHLSIEAGDFTNSK